LAKSHHQVSPIPTGHTPRHLSSARSLLAMTALYAPQGGKPLLSQSTKLATACRSSRLAGPNWRSQCFSAQALVPQSSLSQEASDHLLHGDLCNVEVREFLQFGVWLEGLCAWSFCSCSTGPHAMIVVLWRS
jgi:hypothetical protein